MELVYQPAKKLIACLAIALTVLPTVARGPDDSGNANEQPRTLGMAVAYPFLFDHGTKTSRATALSTAEEILRTSNYASIPGDTAKTAWTSNKLPKLRYGHFPSKEDLSTFGKALNAKVVLYGSVSWHTRSIWVNAGPKTISTATVDVYVFDVESGKTIFSNEGVEGRSDEKEDVYKLAADVLVTPLVSVVSGGPATPREQRAVQIALGVACHSWARPDSKTK